MLVTTSAYRERVARALMGEAVDLAPATYRLGSGRFDPLTGVLTSPSESDSGVLAEVASGEVTLTRSGSTVVALITLVADGEAAYFTEAGLFTADGLCVALDAFRPYPVQAGVTYELRYTIQPGA